MGLTLLGAAIVAIVAVLLLLMTMMRATERETDGVAYFALPIAERRASRARIARRARLIVPFVSAYAAVYRPKRSPMVTHKGVNGPSMTCPPKMFAAAENFPPDARDIFVATQMKCGTTWMQQVVYEVLSRGQGDLGDDGHRHMYAASPWLESRHSVSLENAPRIGERGCRIIKTHMPTKLCPYSEIARYIYVTRHPVACFASTVDFLEMLAGPMCPSRPDLLDWYCSDEMYWRSWPEHVEGWWRWSLEKQNVLFIHYEEMIDDLPAAVRRVAAFLDINVDSREVDRVAEKSSFEYMKRNEDLFEMSPPSPLTRTRGEHSFFKSGKKSRGKNLANAERQRILQFCRDRMRGSAYPAARFYPDLADAR